MQRDNVADVTVIMPCHNASAYIVEALESIREQTTPPVEVIVIDDSSTDDSVEVIEKSGLADRIIRAQVRNAAKARNLGIREAKTGWLAFLDADDVWYPHHLETALETLAKTEDNAYLSNHDEWVSETGQIQLFDPNLGIDPLPGLTIQKAVQFLHEIGLGFATVGMVLKRERVCEVGGFDEDQLRRHDVDLFLRHIQSGTWTYNPNPTFAVRTDTPGNISGNHAETAYYKLRTMIKLGKALPDSEQVKCLVRNNSKKAIREAALSGKKDLFDKVYALAAPQLKLSERIICKTAKHIPGIFQIWGKLKGSGRRRHHIEKDYAGSVATLPEMIAWRREQNQEH